MQYGEVDIDGSLVAAKTAGAEEIMMLNNGCLCCTVRGDLVRMIAELVSRKKGKFDHIVIETTGKQLMRFIGIVLVHFLKLSIQDFSAVYFRHLITICLLLSLCFLTQLTQRVSLHLIPLLVLLC